MVLKILTNVGSPIVRSDGSPVALMPILFELVKYKSNRVTSSMDLLNGDIIAGDGIIAYTDENGEFTTELWPNSRGEEQTAYKVTFGRMDDYYIKPFYILVNEGTPDTLSYAKLAYHNNTGIQVSDVQALLAQYAPLNNPVFTGKITTPALVLNGVDITNTNTSSESVKATDGNYYQLQITNNGDGTWSTSFVRVL